MKVKITNGHSWYKNKVGEIFNVYVGNYGQYSLTDRLVWIRTKDAVVTQDEAGEIPIAIVDEKDIRFFNNVGDTLFNGVL